jgi:hypothetical protein
MMGGISQQATMMKISQVFSHCQRDFSFMGAVNRPLQAPERTARRIPAKFIEQG